MEDGRRLLNALTSSDWERVNALLDEAFFAYLIEEPELLQRLFESASPDWYAKYPRNVLHRAIAEGARRPVWLIDDAAQATFAAWVGSSDHPATRDLLKVRQARLRTLLESGRYQDASALADEIWKLVRSAPDTDGFRDVLPPVLIRAGSAKLSAADFASAIACFSEAVWWSSTRAGNPYTQFARDHLALTFALTERYQQAAELLATDPAPLAPEGTARYHYQSAGILARLLIALGTFALDEAAEVWGRIDAALSGGPWWWVMQHVRANVALMHGTQWDVALRLNDRLIEFGRRAEPGSTAGTLLRSDLATLYQSAGDLRAADKVLRTPGLVRGRSSWRITAARQELMRGRPEQALTILRKQTTDITAPTPVWHLPSGAVLYAAAELAIAGKVSRTSLLTAAAAMNTRRAYAGMMQAPPQLRTLLLPLLDIDPSHVPTVFTYRARVRLTRREREVLRLLREQATVNDIASALYVSPNTAKTHVRALYRKLGAHTRDEALWLGAQAE